MDRLKQWGTVSVLLCVLALGVAPGAGAAGIKLALDCPPDAEKCGTYVWSKAFADHLRANGMEVKEYPAGALGTEDEKLDQVSQGLLEVSNSLLMKLGQLDEMVNGFWLFFLWDSYDHLYRTLEQSDLLDRVNTKLTKKGVRILALVPVGSFFGIANSQRPIRVPADLEGLRMRATDKVQATYLEAWGANSVIIPWGEIYNALQTGVADGYMNPPIVPVLFKHTEVLDYYADLKAGAPLRVAIASEDWYAGLSDKERALVDEAVEKGNEANRAWVPGVTARSIAALEEAGMEVAKPTEEERALFAEKARSVYDQVLSQDIVEVFLSTADKYR
jgi:TRAP-type C4-dicarboxylate transport system substrate-binding protein